MKQVDLAVELLEDLLGVIQVCVCWKPSLHEQCWESRKLSFSDVIWHILYPFFRAYFCAYT